MQLLRTTVPEVESSYTYLLVPDRVGLGAAKRRRQYQTLAIWASISAGSLYTFYTAPSPALRAAAIGLVFPGAGLFAVGTLPSLLLCLLTLLLIPLVLFAWFGAGGLAFPTALWLGSTALSALLARDTLVSAAGPLSLALCYSGIAYLAYKTSQANREAREKRTRRNEYVVDSVRKMQTEGQKAAPGSRELSLRDLRFIQWFIELGMRPMDDFAYHDVIDQFQTAAIRYQLYEATSDLGLYQFVYTPNFHGYLSEAMRRTIEKSLTERVVGFWKWESLWGKGKVSDWDPIAEDNIMVSGYVLQAVGIYQSNTGDDRYTKPGSLTFEVAKDKKYPYDFKRIADAVNRQWEDGPYCLFSCEPNWIYTMCNLTGASGITLASRLLNVPWADKIKSRFEKALDEDFTQQDGTVMTIRSELTGFTIPGLAGRLSDGINALLCAAFLPHIAHRCWSFVLRESINQHSDGSITLENLEGADKLDPGNYRPGVGFTRAVFAAAAAEYGQEGVRKELLRELDEVVHPVFETETGSLKNKGLSTIGQGSAMKARLCGYQDWFSMISHGPPENVIQGPILDEAPFPDVLVAKAYSHDGEGMELVLYSGRESRKFQLGFTRLRAGESYSLAGEKKSADKEGKAVWEVRLEGRTALDLVKH
ncbi:uncharacterized protein LTR77_009986 [Saxophila tyrrhenica]|uniref:Linalool dehydratase/isomerase domain-containing protein n=1 Tax=Saxophila tyrrhenica TaxID=1690608 RepID=A0AAV9NWW2_9PEZI|nr:hypothetical protein LTR77_009986 [Saxophila tyrrhenica]